ncbi:hypothetical protein ACWDXD_33755 [Streptomyces sp. NPDC003314]
MIRVSTIPIPVPGAVTELMTRQLPEHVADAAFEAATSAYTVFICRAPQYREARERALADLARKNKILAAYDPAFVVRGAA